MILNNKKPEMTPAVRVVGYTDDWEQRKLGEIVAIKITNGLMNRPGGNLLAVKDINVVNMYTPDHIHVEDLEYFNATDKDLSRCDVTRGDVFVTRSSLKAEGIAEPNVLLENGRFVFDDHLMRLKPRPEINPYFLKELLSSTSVKKQFIAKAKTATMTTIGQQDISTSDARFPSSTEQKLIAELLQKIDSTIALHQRKLSGLQQARHWAEQNLLPEPNETTPKVRVGEFDDEWIESKLGDFLHSTTSESTIENEYPVLSSTIKHVELRSGRVDGESNIGYRILNSGQLVLSPQNAWMGNINISHVSIGMVSPSYLIYDVIGIDSNYLEAVIKLPSFVFQIGQVSEAGASVVRRNLNKSAFLRIKMCVPPLEKQQVIANVFTTIDARIKSEQQLIADLQAVKRWALDNMFV